MESVVGNSGYGPVALNFSNLIRDAISAFAWSKTTKTVSQDDRRLDRGVNLGPSEYEARVVAARPLCLSTVNPLCCSRVKGARITE
jgi:hypothetical protein